MFVPRSPASRTAVTTVAEIPAHTANTYTGAGSTYLVSDHRDVVAAIPVLGRTPAVTYLEPVGPENPGHSIRWHRNRAWRFAGPKFPVETRRDDTTKRPLVEAKEQNDD
jgi:hypothetical protein